MGKKVIISEEQINHLLYKEFITESTDRELEEKVKKIVADAIKNDRDVQKNFDKKVKNLVASCVNNLFKSLWLKRSWYEDEIKK